MPRVLPLTISRSNPNSNRRRQSPPVTENSLYLCAFYWMLVISILVGQREKTSHLRAEGMLCSHPHVYFCRLYVSYKYTHTICRVSPQFIRKCSVRRQQADLNSQFRATMSCRFKNRLTCKNHLNGLACSWLVHLALFGFSQHNGAKIASACSGMRDFWKAGAEWDGVDWNK